MSTPAVSNPHDPQAMAASSEPTTSVDQFKPVDLGPKPQPTVVNPFAGQGASGLNASLAPEQFVSAARFVVQCQGWTTGLGFSELSGFNSTVASQEYSYNGSTGNVLTRQMGRPSAPSVTLKGGLEKSAFAQMFAWHQLARMNNPLAKTPAYFSIMDAAGKAGLCCVLMEAWCSKVEIDPATAGSASVVTMKVTIECDDVYLV